MMKLARLICGLFAIVVVVVFVGLLTIDHWFSIGERAQGGYPTRSSAEQAEAEARSSAAADAASDAANEALKTTQDRDAVKRDEVKKQ